MENIYKLKSIITNLTKEVKKQDFLVYFRKMSILEIKDNVITFGVESSFTKNNLEAKFMKQILSASQKEDNEIV
jgi:chromosomal replication initiation ATPase DnaA